MATVTVERTINVPLQKVWNVASDFAVSPGPSIKIDLEKEGDPNLNGVGTERTITFLKQNNKIRTRYETVDPPNSFTYSILSGAPVKSYIGKAEFSPNGEATNIKWSGTFTPKIIGIGWLVGRAVLKGINDFIDELEKIE